MKTFKVATVSDLKKMAEMLEKGGHTIIYRDNTSFNAFKNGKLARVVKIADTTERTRLGDEV